MPLTGLYGAAGAYEGLKELLARRLEQEKFAEVKRQALAREALEGRQLDESAALRRAMLAGTEQERVRDEAYRRDALAQGKEVSLAQLAQTRQLQEMLETGRNERAAAGREQQLALRELINATRSEPLYPVDLGDGDLRYIPRSQASGRRPAPPAGMRADLARGAASLEGVDRLAELFKPEYVGPLTGRARSIGQQIPGVPVDPGYAEFEAETAALRNAIIKAITGAQMSEPEARRIMQQIPNIQDKPEVWAAKLTATRRNLDALNARLRGPYAGRPATIPMTPMAAHGSERP